MKIKFVVDKRTELMEVLLKLTDYFEFYPDLKVEIETDYIKYVEKYFAPFKEHRAVNLLNEIIHNLNFCYDAPISLALQLNEDFTFTELEPYPFEERCDKDPRILEFLKEMKKFALDSNFDKFYNEHKKVFAKWISATQKQVGEQILDYMDKFYKEKLNRKYVINLMPLQTNGNYGCSVKDTSICNACIKYNDKADKNFIFMWKDDSSALVQHEFLHPLINPLTSKYFDYSKMPKLPKKILKQMEELTYTDGETYVDEQVIRCTTILYLTALHGEEKQEEWIKDEEEQGFIHTRPILQALKEYEKQDLPLRKYYPKLMEEFYKPLEIKKETTL